MMWLLVIALIYLFGSTMKDYIKDFETREAKLRKELDNVYRELWELEKMYDSEIRDIRIAMEKTACNIRNEIRKPKRKER